MSQKCLDIESLQIQVTKNPVPIKVLLVSTSWNKFYVKQMTDKLIKELFKSVGDDNTISITHKNVPGCWELPIAIQTFCNRANPPDTGRWPSPEKYDVVIAVGVLIKGDTKHFEYISKSVFDGLMSLQLQLQTPIINGVLTVMKEEQIEERIELAKEWATGAIYMSQL